MDAAGLVFLALTITLTSSSDNLASSSSAYFFLFTWRLDRLFWRSKSKGGKGEGEEVEEVEKTRNTFRGKQNYSGFVRCMTEKETNVYSRLDYIWL